MGSSYTLEQLVWFDRCAFFLDGFVEKCRRLGIDDVTSSALFTTIHGNLGKSYSVVMLYQEHISNPEALAAIELLLEDFLNS